MLGSRAFRSGRIGSGRPRATRLRMGRGSSGRHHVPTIWYIGRLVGHCLGASWRGGRHLAHAPADPQAVRARACSAGPSRRASSCNGTRDSASLLVPNSSIPPGARPPSLSASRLESLGGFCSYLRDRDARVISLQEGGVSSRRRQQLAGTSEASGRQDAAVAGTGAAAGPNSGQTETNPGRVGLLENSLPAPVPPGASAQAS